MSAQSPTRWEAHEAIETALNPETETPDLIDALQTVVRYGARLPKKPRFTFIVWFPNLRSLFGLPDKDPKSLTGHTSEAGDIQIDEPHSKKTGDQDRFRLSNELEKDRVGHYRLSHGRKGYLIFHHFWASDDTTRVSDSVLDGPTEYCIRYDEATLEPIEFSEIVFRIWSPWLEKIGLRLIDSTDKWIWRQGDPPREPTDLQD